MPRGEEESLLQFHQLAWGNTQLQLGCSTQREDLLSRSTSVATSDLGGMNSWDTCSPCLWRGAECWGGFWIWTQGARGKNRICPYKEKNSKLWALLHFVSGWWQRTQWGFVFQVFLAKLLDKAAWTQNHPCQITLRLWFILLFHCFVTWRHVAMLTDSFFRLWKCSFLSSEMISSDVRGLVAVAIRLKICLFSYFGSLHKIS